MTVGRISLALVCSLSVLAGCALQPAQKTAPNELSAKVGGYYKYRQSIQRESSFYNEYSYARIDEQDGKDRITLCKDLQLGMVSFRPDFHYLTKFERSDLGETRSYEAFLPGSSKDTNEQSVRIDTVTYKDGTTSAFIVTERANRYLARTPLIKVSSADFDAGCKVTEDTNTKRQSLF